VTAKRRAVSRELIVQRAIELADAEGVPAITARRLADTFGVTPMAIYRHVQDKAHVLDLSADYVLNGVVERARSNARTDRGPWQERLRGVLNAFEAELVAHPGGPELLTRPSMSPAKMRIAELLLDVLDQAGFGPSEAFQLLDVIVPLVVGSALGRRMNKASRDVPPRRERMRQLVAGTRSGEFPRVVAGRKALLAQPDRADRGAMTVGVIVAGIEALASRHRGRTTRRRK
jgi:AcrR family transcriptional regulator